MTDPIRMLLWQAAVLFKELSMLPVFVLAVPTAVSMPLATMAPALMPVAEALILAMLGLPAVFLLLASACGAASRPGANETEPN